MRPAERLIEKMLGEADDARSRLIKMATQAAKEIKAAGLKPPASIEDCIDDEFGKLTFCCVQPPSLSSSAHGKKLKPVVSSIKKQFKDAHVWSRDGNDLCISIEDDQ